MLNRRRSWPKDCRLTPYNNMRLRGLGWLGDYVTSDVTSSRMGDHPDSLKWQNLATYTRVASQPFQPYQP